jgi:uncharacterized protein
MNRFEQLAELQDIDMRIEENVRSRREAEARFGDDASLIASQKTVDDTNRLANEIRARLRSLELEVDGIEEKIKEVEARLYDGRTTSPKELSGLEQDAVMLKRRRNQVEDRMLEAMAQLETTEAAHVANRAALDKVSAETNTTTTRARAALEELEGALAKLNVARGQLSAQIAPADLAVYENLRREKKGRALARIKGSACEVCGFAVPSGVASRVRVGHELEFCSNCGRILIS